MDKHNTPTGRPVAPETQRALRDIVNTIGERDAAKRLNISRNALCRALAGLGVRAGTAALIAIGLTSNQPNRAA